MASMMHDAEILNGTIQTAETLSGALSSQESLSGTLGVPTVVGQTNYERLNNKPSIESVTLIGDKTFSDLGLSAIEADDLIEILT